MEELALNVCAEAFVLKTGIYLLLGLLIGFIFGFLLQRGRISKYETIINGLLFKDLTLLKFMFTAVLTGMLGIYALSSFGVLSLKIGAAAILANILGGFIFGIGFGLLGY